MKELQKARFSKNTKFRSQARMFLTSGYVLTTHVLVKLGRKHAFRWDLSKKKDDVLKSRLGQWGMFLEILG